jgi:hypothetical protein
LGEILTNRRIIIKWDRRKKMWGRGVDFSGSRQESVYERHVGSSHRKLGTLNGLRNWQHL